LVSASLSLTAPNSLIEVASRSFCAERGAKAEKDGRLVEVPEKPEIDVFF
jgi:hypothetical protein